MSDSITSAAVALARLRALGSPRKAAFLAGFFKTGPGEYGEGDVFAGVTVPETRALARACRALSDAGVRRLLRHRIHEARLLALLILVDRFERGDARTRRAVFALYLRERRWVNNWDLVDLSAPNIVGAHLRDDARGAGVPELLRQLARAPRLWDRRIGMLATHAFIREGEFAPALHLARVLMRDPEDLMHKAVGWMLREVGKRDPRAEEAFLQRHYRRMPRTMLRYAIERFPERQRQQYLQGTA